MLSSSGIIKDDHQERIDRFWNAMQMRADAKKMLAQLRTLPNIGPRVLRLWSLYADTIPEARSASL